MRPDRTNMTAVRGFYISSGGEVLSSFRQSVALMRQEDKESYLAIFRRVLSGTQDKNLIDLSFRTSQVADSDEHRLLMRLRDSGLEDEEAVQKAVLLLGRMGQRKDEHIRTYIAILGNPILRERVLGF